FIEIPHDFFHAAVSATGSEITGTQRAADSSPAQEIVQAAQQIAASKKPVLLLGAGARKDRAAIQRLAELLQTPVFTTTSGKGMIAADHPLALSCISRLGAVQDVLLESDLLISFGARLTEFDTGRFGLKLPAQHIQVVSDLNYAGNRLPSTL